MRTVVWIVGALVVVVVAVVAVLLLNSGNLIRSAVETLGSQALGVPVTLEAAELSLSEGAAELRGLVVANPEGFDGPEPFRLGRIRVAVDPAQLGTDLVVLRDVQVDRPELGLVTRGVRTNIQALLANLQGDGSSTGGSSDGAAAGPKLIIDRFSFTNARTSLDSDIVGASSVDLPDIRLQDIGRKSSGVTVREALEQILRPIARASTEALARQGVDVEGLRGQAEERLDEARQRLDQTLRDRLGSGLDALRNRGAEPEPEPN
jgi:uncharacterized protein involved in outer membrane biogenesis